MPKPQRLGVVTLLALPFLSCTGAAPPVTSIEPIETAAPTSMRDGRLDKRSTPPFAPPFAPRTENVVLVTLDGVRWQEVFDGVDPALADRAGLPKSSVI